MRPGTAGPRTERVTVEAGQVIRFPPGEFQSGHDHTDEPVRALAVGAPGARHDVRPPNADGVMQLVCQERGETMF